MDSAKTKHSEPHTKVALINSNSALHEILTVDQIIDLKTLFKKAYGGFVLKDTLRRALVKIANLTFTEEEYDSLFSKIHINRQNEGLSWRAFLSYLILGYQQEYTQSSCRLELPITGLSKVLRTHHRHPVSRITFIPEINKNRTLNHLHGCYVTMSKDGIINYWSLDMEHDRSVHSTCPQLKVQPTWLTDMVGIPDLSILCTSSTERDLRFYDTSAKKFELRISVTSFTNAVVTMYYRFYEDPTKLAKLIVGDSGGRVKLISFVPKDKGPFKSKPGNPLITVTYEQFLKGAIPAMSIIEIDPYHTDWVRQVSYIESIHCIVSVSPCSKISMLIQNPRDDGVSYIFQVPKGFTCFALEETSNLVATGGSDCLIRLWNPVVPSRVIFIFRGHHVEIVSLIFQDAGKTLCSISKDKCVKVWDCVNNHCLQTFINLPSSLGEHTALATYYNPGSREVFIASMKIVVFQLTALLNAEYTDGISHSNKVSVILYNKLFKSIISCGMDSVIIVWNPWTGRRLRLIREAHCINVHGETRPLPITAATLNPSGHYLITGGTNGTLKVWNYTNGVCLRNMLVDPPGEIFAINWIPGRIFVSGFNCGVTEYIDSYDVGEVSFKTWLNRHSQPVICSAVYHSSTVATGTDNGELMLWRRETTKAYGKYHVSRPEDKIKITVDLPKKDVLIGTQSLVSCALKKGGGIMKTGRQQKPKPPSDPDEVDAANKMAAVRGTMAIHWLLFLETRPVKVDIGALLVAKETGNIQIWSHHPHGGLKDRFKAIHKTEDFVLCMTTDEENVFLFTGHLAGYIKIWLLTNFGIPEQDHVHICMPKLRMIFPFMWKDTFLGTAKRRYTQQYPILLSSYKGHVAGVTGLLFINATKIVVSCSADCSVRLWTLGGRYLGTLGTFKPWIPISPSVPPDDFREYTVPADIRRSMSSTTFKILNGGQYERRLTKKQLLAKEKTMRTEIKGVYGERVDQNYILGHHFKLPVRSNKYPDINLDTTVHHVPVYNQIYLSVPDLGKYKATDPNVTAKLRNFKYNV